MDYSISILLMTFCVWTSAYEPVAIMMERRRNAYPVYTSDLIEEYEPYAVAAIPMNPPMQLFQVIPPTQYPSKSRKPAKRPPINRDLQDYASSNLEPAYEPYTYDNIYSDSISQPKYKVSPYEEEPVIYSRPNKNSGYGHRKAPTPAPQAQREPIIIRIHKYRVIH